MNHGKVSAVVSVLVIALLLLSVGASAQSIVTGDVTGTITDPSGAVVSGATVTLKNIDTNATQNTTTNANGFYRFPLQKPGRYVVTLAQPGFQTVNQPVVVAVGQATTANVRLSVGQSSQTVEVTAETPVVQTENGNIATSFDARQIESIPNPVATLRTLHRRRRAYY